MRNSLLIEDYPLLVLPRLATVLGLNEAIFLQQIHYWLRENERHKRHKSHYRAGHWWTYNSYENWQKNNFPFWSISTLKRISKALSRPYTPKKATDTKISREALIITTDKYNRDCTDRTLWYTIDYEALAEIEAELEKRRGCQNDTVESAKVTPSEEVKMTLSKGQNDTLRECQNGTLSSETSSEISPETSRWGAVLQFLEISLGSAFFWLEDSYVESYDGIMLKIVAKSEVAASKIEYHLMSRLAKACKQEFENEDIQIEVHAKEENKE